MALVGAMRRDLVEQRRWITPSDYQEGLALAYLAPGPLAAQLAIYLGYVHYRFVGATLAGLAFVLPSFVMVVALGWIYTLYGGLAWMQAVFYGVGASVIGILAMSAYKLSTKTIGRDWLLWAIFLAIALVTIITQTEQVLLFLLAGLLVWFVKAPPTFRWGKSRSGAPIASVTFIPMASLMAVVGTTRGTRWALLTYFMAAGAFVFGSRLAIVPFLI